MGMSNNLLQGLCQFIGPFLGHGAFTAILVLIVTAVAVGLWLLSENKEGMVVFIIRAGIAVSVLVNIVLILSLFGLSNPCTSIQ